MFVTVGAIRTNSVDPYRVFEFPIFKNRVAKIGMGDHGVSEYGARKVSFTEIYLRQGSDRKKLSDPFWGSIFPVFSPI